jgi:hypothetical protein
MADGARARSDEQYIGRYGIQPPHITELMAD